MSTIILDDCLHYLIEGQKCGKVGLKIDNPLILYDLDNNETDDYKRLQLEVRE